MAPRWLVARALAVCLLPFGFPLGSRLQSARASIAGGGLGAASLERRAAGGVIREGGCATAAAAAAASSDGGARGAVSSSARGGGRGAGRGGSIGGGGKKNPTSAAQRNTTPKAQEVSSEADFEVTAEEAERFVSAIGGEDALMDALKSSTATVVAIAKQKQAQAEKSKTPMPENVGKLLDSLINDCSTAKSDQRDNILNKIGDAMCAEMNNPEFIDWFLSGSAQDSILDRAGISPSDMSKVLERMTAKTSSKMSTDLVRKVKDKVAQEMSSTDLSKSQKAFMERLLDPKSKHLDKKGSTAFMKEFGAFLGDNMEDPEFVDWILSEDAEDLVKTFTGVTREELEVARMPLRAASNGGDIEAALKATSPEGSIPFTMPPKFSSVHHAPLTVQMHSSVLTGGKEFFLACEGERNVLRLKFEKVKSRSGSWALQAEMTHGKYPALQPWFMDDGFNEVGFYGRLSAETWSYEEELVTRFSSWKRMPNRTSVAIPNAMVFMPKRVGVMPIVKLLTVHFSERGVVDLRHKCVGARTTSFLLRLMSEKFEERPVFDTEGLDLDFTDIDKIV